MPRMQEDSKARRAIIREWDNWVRNYPEDSKGAAAVLFFNYLQDDKSELLDFYSTGDKWQTVHGWLRREGRVKD